MTIEGLDSIDRDYNREYTTIASKIPSALQNVGSEMIAALQKHIREDVYDAWGQPVQYVRRGDDNSYGTPLYAEQNMDISVSGMSMRFSYEPTGEHAMIDDEYSVDGDALINVIQKNFGWRFRPRFDRQGRAIMPRPFWNNFVEEMENGGIMDAFIRGMDGYKVVPQGGSNDVIFSGDESKL